MRAEERGFIPDSPYLNKSSVREGKALRVADDDVVDELHADRRQRVLEPAREVDVRLARLGHSGWMVVRANHGRSIVMDEPPNDLADVHASGVEGAVEQLLERQQPVAMVEEQAAKHLLRPIAELRLQEGRHGLRTLEAAAAAQRLAVVAPS